MKTLVVALLGALAAAPLAAATPVPSATPLLVPFTDHYSMRVERPAREVWEHVKSLYVAGERPRQQGYQVTPLTSDATAWLGGTVSVSPAKTDRPKVTMRVSALDDTAMLLTLQIELENPVAVYVVHQVRPDGANAAIYQTIVQTQWPLAVKAGETPTPKSVAATMAAVVKHHNDEVVAIMQREKVIMESAR